MTTQPHVESETRAEDRHAHTHAAERWAVCLNLIPTIVSLDATRTNYSWWRNIAAFRKTEADDWFDVGHDFRNSLLETVRRHPDVYDALETGLRKRLLDAQTRAEGLSHEEVEKLGELVALLAEVKVGDSEEAAPKRHRTKSAKNAGLVVKRRST